MTISRLHRTKYVLFPIKTSTNGYYILDFLVGSINHSSHAAHYIVRAPFDRDLTAPLHD